MIRINQFQSSVAGLQLKDKTWYFDITMHEVDYMEIAYHLILIV